MHLFILDIATNEIGRADMECVVAAESPEQAFDLWLTHYAENDEHNVRRLIEDDYHVRCFQLPAVPDKPGVFGWHSADMPSSYHAIPKLAFEAILASSN